MGRVIATCGHEIPETSDKYCITRKGFTREGLHSLSFVTACLKCQGLYKEWGETLENVEEETAWLRLL